METEADVFNSSNTTSPVSVTQEEENPLNTSQVTESTVLPVKRPRMHKPKSKSADHSIELAKLSLLQQVQDTLSASNADSEELFGQQVASELRSIKDRTLQLRLRRNIMNIIYDTQEAEQAGNSQPSGLQVRSPFYPTHPYQVQPTPQEYPSPSPLAQPMSFLKMMNSE